MKKLKKLTVSQLGKKIWEHCKRLVREKYVNKNGTFTCYTCGKIITDKSNAHTGHFIPSSVCGYYLRYDLRNLRIQCMACNVWGGGMGAIYYKNMVEREGQEYVDQLFRDKQKSVKAYDHLVELLDKYENI